MNPFEIPGGLTSETAHEKMGGSLSVQARPRPPFFIIVACLVAGQFMPWIQIRIPGQEMERLSLFDFRGGSGFVFAFFFFFSIGMLMWTAKVRSGAAIAAVSIAFVGWFGVLVNVSLGALRGMIPQIGIGKIDLGRGIIGVGAGAVIVVAALLLVAMELLPRGDPVGSRHRMLDGFGVAGFFIGVALAMTHTAVWVSGSSSKFESELRLSGDSLFGSFILSTLVWTTAIVGVLVALRTSGRGHRVLALTMVIAGIVKFFHALIFVIGKGLVNLLLPGSVGDVAELRLHWPLWITMILSVLSVIVGFVGFISDGFRESVSRLASFEYLPSIALAVATAATFVTVRTQSSDRQQVVDSAPTDTTMVVPDTTMSTSPPPKGDAASADYISRSVVLVTVSTTSGEVCWTGSGVAVLDGFSILTNDHVVTPESGDDPECSVISVGITDDPASEPSRYVRGMTITANDPELDLAVLQMPAADAVRLRPLDVSDVRLKIDTKIRIIGYPGVGGDTITLNEGVISGVDKRSGTEFYKVSAQISPGNSGGPMVDADGNLVGIATAYMPADVKCDDRDSCYAAGANLGLVRPIALASGVLSR
jgi:V8-like Glu-specific endopeptidase